MAININKGYHQICGKNTDDILNGTVLASQKWGMVDRSEVASRCKLEDEGIS